MLRLDLEAEVLDGIDEECRVFFRGLCIDAVSKVHDVVAPPAIAEDLLRALLWKRFAENRKEGESKGTGIKHATKTEKKTKIATRMPACYNRFSTIGLHFARRIRGNSCLSQAKYCNECPGRVGWVVAVQ